MLVSYELDNRTFLGSCTRTTMAWGSQQALPPRQAYLLKRSASRKQDSRWGAAHASMDFACSISHSLVPHRLWVDKVLKDIILLNALFGDEVAEVHQLQRHQIWNVREPRELPFGRLHAALQM